MATLADSSSGLSSPSTGSCVGCLDGRVEEWDRLGEWFREIPSPQRFQGFWAAPALDRVAVAIGSDLSPIGPSQLVLVAQCFRSPAG